MADSKHLEIIQLGVRAWNMFVEKQGFDFIPDLDDAELNGANLSWANLSDAVLNRANLNNAVLNRANLSMANLSMAKLNNAVLNRANLSMAKLNRAKLNAAMLNWAMLNWAMLNDAELNDAVLNRANLNGANLNRANLTEANLTEANLAGANLAEANLTKAILDHAMVLSIQRRQEPHQEPRWIFTDLSGVQGLTQKQLNSMIGDSGTIIPDHLERPAHWITLDIRQNDEKEQKASQTLLQQINDASPLEIVVKDAKLHGDARPAGARPEVDKPHEVKAQLEAQIYALKDTLAVVNALPSTKVNFPRAALKRRLSSYLEALNSPSRNWYLIDSSFQALERLIAVEGGIQALPEDLPGIFEGTFEKHKTLEPLIRSKESKSLPEFPIPDEKLASVPVTKPILEKLVALVRSLEARRVMEYALRRMLIRDLQSLKNEDVKSGAWRRVLNTVGAILLTVSSGLIVAALASPTAGTIILQNFRFVWEMLLKHFGLG